MTSKPKLSSKDRRLFNAVVYYDADSAEAVQQAIRNGANVDCVRNSTTPLLEACRRGRDQVIRILLDAGADARWRNPGSSGAWTAMTEACYHGHLSTVQLLINYDNGLLKMTNNTSWTPLIVAIREQHSDIVRFLLDSGADAHHVDEFGETTLMTACEASSLEIVRLLLAAGVDVEARDTMRRTALHSAVDNGDRSELLRELVLQHNANMFAVDGNGRTPFDNAWNSEQTADFIDHLLETYGNKLTQEHGSLALHELLKVAQYSFAKMKTFHPPLNPLQIILPLGKLKLMHLRTLLHSLDPELIRTRDGTGKLPIHIACQKNAPVEVLALILELDPAARHVADNTGALPIHLLCGTTLRANKYASVRYLVDQGGVGTLAARNRQGLLPLHVLCRSTNPPLRTVQFLFQSFPASVAMRTNAGQYPFMMASATKSNKASLSVSYELVRANPGLVVPR